MSQVRDLTGDIMNDKPKDEKEECAALMAGTLGELKQVKKPKEANDG